MPRFPSAGSLAAVLAALLMACRLTAGPPPRTTVTPAAPARTRPAATVPAAPLRTPEVRPSLTPFLLPTRSPTPTPLVYLPPGLPLITPENAATVRVVAQLVGTDPQPLASLAFAPEGGALATIDCYQRVKVWGLSSGEERVVPEGDGAGICKPGWRVAFSPDGNTLAATTTLSNESTWGAVRLFDVANLTGPGSLAEIDPEEAGRGEPKALAATLKSLTSVAFSPSGLLLAAGSNEAAAYLWEVHAWLARITARPPEPVTLEHEDWVIDVAFSPSGETLATATAVTVAGRLAYAVKLWDVSDPSGMGEADIQEHQTLLAPSGPVWQVAFSPDGRYIAAAGGGMTLWDAAGGEARLAMNLPVSRLAFSPNGRLLAAAGEDLLALWDFNAALEAENSRDVGLVLLDGKIGRVESLAFAPDGRALATASEDGIVRLWGIAP